MSTEAPVRSRLPLKERGLSPAKVLPADPQVYLLAARLISQRAQFHSCLAIRKAFKVLYAPNGTTDAQLAEGSMFEAQYESMFGPDEPVGMEWHPGLNRYKTLSHYDSALHAQHPFWDKPDDFYGGLSDEDMRTVPESLWKRYSPYRIQALLFMAEIVGNP